MAQDLTGLNSLRQALTPYEDVKFELNLNRHPKAHKNKSIIYAENMKLSKDGAVLENEESIEVNVTINDALKDAYQNRYTIIHIIPCNTELVLFVKDSDKNTFDIWRYREKTNKYVEKIARFYKEGIVYNGGKFSGTFTYTSNDSLIIAFCEYDSRDSTIMNPMMTINLGTFTKGNLSPDGVGPRRHDWISSLGEFTDRTLNPYKLPICPEVSLPQITNVTNIKGNSYIGTYYVYIRYKINKYDYTQWFNIGYPIINEYKQESIIHQKITVNDENKSDNNEEDLLGSYKTTKEVKLSIYTNQDKDLINNSINIKLNHINKLYDYCQIGFICISKTYTKYFVSSDLILNTNIEISTNIDNLKEEIFNTNLYENYYNVKNIINKNNKLYISNYLTTNNKNINVDDINLSLQKGIVVKNEYKENDKITIGGIEFDEKEILSYYYTTITKYINDDYEEEILNVKLISLPYFLKINNLDSDITSKLVTLYNETTNIFNINELYIGVVKTIISGEVNDTNSDSTEYLIRILDKYEIDNPVSMGGLIRDNFEFFRNSAISGKNASFENRDLYLNFVTEQQEIISTLNLNDIRSTLVLSEDIYPENYLKNKIYYYNRLDNYINNNIISSLCQGEVYDFYIHFIDKYGYITDGYRLKNKNILTAEIKSGEKKEVCFIKYDDGIYIINAQDNIFIKDENNNYIINLNVDNIRLLDNYVITPKDCDITVNIDNTANPLIYIENIKKLLEELLKLPEYYLNNLVFGDIFDYHPESITDDIYFLNYINSQNKNYFKIPRLISNDGDIQLGLKVEIGDITDYGDYVSYFISYKKLEKTYVLNGFGTKHQLNNIILNNKFKSGNIIKLYNIKDKVNWDVDLYDKCVLQNNIILKNEYNLYVNLLNNIAYAQDAQLNRDNRQTTLYLSDNISEFANLPEDNENILRDILGVKYLEILNLDKNKYINNTKLYRLGNIEYMSCIINNGLNGKYDKDLSIRYGNENNGVCNILSNNGLGSYGDVCIYEIFSFKEFDELGLYLSEKPKFHDIYVTNIDYQGNESKYKKGKDVFYEVINTLNCFNYKISNVYDTWINFYNVFDEDNDFLKEFNRTIYRSAVISDEGRTNNWRWFENDAYKNIEENKGNITNLLAIGNYLYVHTEHSLFAFSEDNTLSMNNQNLQVATPDIFDTEYKEVFITKLGYGGLQDKNAWIAGQFGYIWFDGDSKKIFKVYGNSMDIISNDIQEWLENAYINQVRFASDIKNNRILIFFNIWDHDENDVDVTISYNILFKSFISFHNFTWYNSYNTKNNLYYLFANNTISQYNEGNYGMNINNKKIYTVSFIVNPYYREIKYLEHITFKLRQRNIRNIDNSFGIIADCAQFPVEKDLLPFQPESIRVYNDLVDTNIIFCDSIDKDTGMPKNNVENYQTPYWDLGNWNFSFLRDVEHYPESEYSDNYCSRLFGNYFVITFDFGYVDTLIEFENLEVRLTKDKEL